MIDCLIKFTLSSPDEVPHKPLHYCEHVIILSDSSFPHKQPLFLHHAPVFTISTKICEALHFRRDVGRSQYQRLVVADP